MRSALRCFALLSAALIIASCSGVDPTTALVEAVKANDLEAARAALAKDAKIDEFRENLTPLMLAVQHKNLAMVDLLAEAGADPNISINFVDAQRYRKVFHSALRFALLAKNLDIIKALRDAGLNFTVPCVVTNDRYGSRLAKPIEGVVYHPLSAAAELGDLEMMRYLIDNGVDPNIPALLTMAPLMAAIQSGQVESIAFLLEHGATMDGALVDASYKPDVRIAQALIEHGAEINEPDPFQNSPLGVAARNGHFGLVNYYVEQGADVNNQKNGCKPPLVEALESGHFDVAEYLLEHGAVLNAAKGQGTGVLTAAIKNADMDFFKSLMEMGADIFEADQNGYMPLHLAAEHGRVDILELLLQENVNLDLPTPMMDTPLMLATHSAQVAAARFLLEHGADPNKRDSQGKTALDHAKKYEDDEMARLIETALKNRKPSPKDSPSKKELE